MLANLRQAERSFRLSIRNRSNVTETGIIPNVCSCLNIWHVGRKKRGGDGIFLVAPPGGAELTVTSEEKEEEERQPTAVPRHPPPPSSSSSLSSPDSCPIPFSGSTFFTCLSAQSSPPLPVVSSSPPLLLVSKQEGAADGAGGVALMKPLKRGAN